MKRLLILASLSAALMTSGCITVIDAKGDDDAWHGNNAQPFDAARADCDARTESRDAFRACMAEKGWTRD
ncbi:hypothetical protein BZG35_00605 [Brevundimonas sp. LM2]|uniref:hypothetical protein n=1 Tax=Brevundimonas sp. LM2 TaxID=1938605 RepID=UPI000983BCDE|nr:hypothetical protein [Brevundimonas sp. LM2]AQR60320.1 hypothetical protein BZG35_00605 [Brevundimonas sp. LM2]